VDESVLQMRRKLAALDAGARRASRDEAQRRTDALERSRRMDRVCMVIDFDMFYAAVELRDRPELRELPVAVGGPGMITTANYVARRWGVRSAMPGFVGQALCRRGAEFGQPKAELIFL
jgi:DNA polymerase kappa